MNVRALIDCVGLDYDLKAGDTANLKKDTAEKLISFSYVEEVNDKKPKESRAKE